MQIYTDVIGREIKIALSLQASAFGAAMFGAIAAGSEAGGYDSIEDAVEHMASLEKKTYLPIPKTQRSITNYLPNIENYMIILVEGKIRR